jgi:hypothetical protein
MKYAFFVIAMMMSTSSFAGKIKSCDELKSEVAARIAANGGRNFELKIITRGEKKPNGSKIVGSCENTAKYIIQIKK